MVVPALVVELDELHAAFGQPPREQAVGREASRLAGVGSVQLEDVAWLPGRVHHLGDRGLHTVGHFVLSDAGVDLLVGKLQALELVQFAQPVKHQAAAGAGDAFRIVEVKHGLAARAELHTLVARREKPASPQPGVKGLVRLLPGNQHDEGGQVLIVAAQTIMDPRPDAGPARELRSGLKECDRRVVVDCLGKHRPDDAELVDHFRRVRKQLADPGARLAVLPKLEQGSRQR